MSFLGTFLTGQRLAFRVTWNPDVGEAPITGSELTLIDPNRIKIVIEAETTGVENEWSAIYTPTRAGNWEIHWESTPPGGVRSDSIFVDR